MYIRSHSLENSYLHIIPVVENEKKCFNIFFSIKQVSVLNESPNLEGNSGTFRHSITKADFTTAYKGTCIFI
jgi:hypothetical protein